MWPLQEATLLQVLHCCSALRAMAVPTSRVFRGVLRPIGRVARVRVCPVPRPCGTCMRGAGVVLLGDVDAVEA